MAFDVDGNLVRSVDAYQEVFSEVAGNYGVPKERHYGHLIRTTGDPIEKQFGAVMDLPCEHPQVLEAVAGWRRMAYSPDKIAPLYGDVLPCFEALKTAGYRLCATSSMKQDHLERTARAHGFGQWLSFWLGTDDRLIDKSHHKPMIIGRFGITPAEFEGCSYLSGDGKVDMRIAKRWGSRGVFTVRRGYEGKSSEEVLGLLGEEGYEAFAVVKSLTELPDVIFSDS